MRYCIIGPTYPYRGGIAHYTTLLAKEVQQSDDVLLISFSRQYPKWLFPGKSDKDPSQNPVQTPAEYLLDPLNPLSWWHTARRIRAWGADVVIMQWWHPFFAPAWAFLTRLLKRPFTNLIVICHNVTPHEKGSPLTQRLLPLALRLAIGKADGYVVHSQADGLELEAILPTAVYTITAHPTYAELGKTSAVALPVALPQAVPMILFCGFIRPYKGVDILISALPVLLKQQAAHLVIAGEFWQNGEAQYRQQIEALGLESAVTIINHYLPDEQLGALMAQADVVVLPYRSATQSGIVQMAFGHEQPVITTNVGGLAEAVTDGKTGLVVPPEDPDELAQALIRYFAEELKPIFKQNIMKENGRFSWHHLVTAVKTLLTI